MTSETQADIRESIKINGNGKRKKGMEGERYFESQRCLFRSQYILACLQRNREKKGCSMLTGLLSGLKWINWLNTHGGWSETTPSPPFNYLWSLPPTLRYSETSGYISPLWKLVPLPLPPFAPRETPLSQVSLRIRKPRWGIFRRILHVTPISIPPPGINIPRRIFQWKLSSRSYVLLANSLELCVACTMSRFEESTFVTTEQR